MIKKKYAKTDISSDVILGCSKIETCALFQYSAAEVPVKFQSDHTILKTNLVASRLCDILQ